jgi:2,3-bisphosphoglycerate-dependent phosphoglycerate mutase
MVPLVLLRHGESIWNRDDRFTGWTDVDLTERGEAEAERAGRLLVQRAFGLDVCFTSVLKRSIKSLWIVLEVMDLMWVPVRKSWRLNERHYGALQGLSKAETANKMGTEQVFAWRRHYKPRPPAVEPTDKRFPGHDRRYADLAKDQLPRTESLKDAFARVMPYWSEVIAPEIRQGRTVLICGHGNSLRALVKHLDRIPAERVPELEIPTGRPLVYELDEGLRPINRYYLDE